MSFKNRDEYLNIIVPMSSLSYFWNKRRNHLIKNTLYHMFNLQIFIRNQLLFKKFISIHIWDYKQSLKKIFP